MPNPRWKKKPKNANLFIASQKIEWQTLNKIEYFESSTVFLEHIRPSLLEVLIVLFAIF